MRAQRYARHLRSVVERTHRFWGTGARGGEEPVPSCVSRVDWGGGGGWWLGGLGWRWWVVAAWLGGHELDTVISLLSR